MDFTKFSSDQDLNAWMATKFYSGPLVVDFPHSCFLVPEITKFSSDQDLNA